MGQPLEVVYTGVSSYLRVPSFVSADIVARRKKRRQEWKSKSLQIRMKFEEETS